MAVGAYHFDLGWAAPDLAVGAAFPPEAAPRLAGQLGIDRVVDLRAERGDDEQVLNQHGIELLRLPTEDARAISQPMLDEGVAWIRAQRARGHKVLVHCQYGIGRSALLALCALAADGLEPLEALRRLKAAREVVSPSPEQLQAFRAWLIRHGRPAPRTDALYEIAYAHLASGQLGSGTLE
jgi:hypothetical protein